MKRKTFDNYDYEEAFPVELDRDIQKKARKNFEKEHPLQVPDYEEQWKEQQEKLKEWELERLLKEGKVESLYRTTTTKAKNLQSGSELLEAQIYPSFCHKADVPHTKKEINEYLDEDSDFIQLQHGTNTIRYTADAGEDYLNVTVSYRFRYLGV